LPYGPRQQGQGARSTSNWVAGGDGSPAHTAAPIAATMPVIAQIRMVSMICLIARPPDSWFAVVAARRGCQLE
jgi:hypothetical protein